jgi:sterol desaturase/sphingolipid hydroxylase (fatty acid hydroxylase superfamily)
VALAGALDHHHSPGLVASIVGVFVLLLLMDFGMYLSHRIAHDPWLYKKIHATHQSHQVTNPISLFVLSPSEVLGFGIRMLSVLVAMPFSGTSILVYLLLNVLFGTLGHAGVEPFPKSWARWIIVRQIGTSTFHAKHHLQPRTNYGFYTVIWDRLFGTLHPQYDAAISGQD